MGLELCSGAWKPDFGVCLLLSRSLDFHCLHLSFCSNITSMSGSPIQPVLEKVCGCIILKSPPGGAALLWVTWTVLATIVKGCMVVQVVCTGTKVVFFARVLLVLPAEGTAGPYTLHTVN